VAYVYLYITQTQSWNVRLKFGKIVETCIYSSDLEVMKDFYVNNLGLDLVSEGEGRYVFLKAGKSMLLVFNAENTRLSDTGIFPVHGAITPPSSIHFALEIEEIEYETTRNILLQNGVSIKKEISWDKGGKSIYFRDPVGNLVEIITKGQWPVED
jgi:catechol 2,3-dioxygenase-like lactoylglutathione lyase family enzyme